MQRGPAKRMAAPKMWTKDWWICFTSRLLILEMPSSTQLHQKVSRDADAAPTSKRHQKHLMDISPRVCGYFYFVGGEDDSDATADRHS